MPVLELPPLPALPLTSPTLVFAVLVALALIAPVLAERVRVPGIIGLIVAGSLIGPGVLGVVARTGAVATLAELGLLYFVFQLSLSLDLDALRSPRRGWMTAGALGFLLPLVLGSGSAALMGYGVHAALLVGTWWTLHTLVAYGVYHRLGLGEHRAVQAAAGGAIVANSAGVLLLGLVAHSFPWPMDWRFWALLVPRLALFAGIVGYALPRVARWFFAGMGQDRSVRFLFLLSALFGASALAETVGLERIVGAYLAGLALNRLVPRGGLLSERVEFFGSAFLTPIFLLSVGMLVDLRRLGGDWRLLTAAAVFTLVVIASSALAAAVAGAWLGFDRAETGAVFSLSVSQGTLTLAGVVIGLDAGIIDLDTVQAVAPVIVATCVLGTWAANRWAQRLPRPPTRPPGIGESVLVPVSNPDSVRGLMHLAALLARPESGTVMPLTVVGPELSDEDLERSRELAARAESMALSQGAEATGIVRIDGSPSSGVLHTIVEHRATFMLVGWKGYTGTRESLFGGVIDEIVGRSSVPLAVTRLMGERFDRILLCVFTGSLPLNRRPGVLLAVEIARRIAAGSGVRVEVLTDAKADGGLDQLLAGVEVAVYRDERRQHVAIGHHIRAEDLLVVSVSPTETGLRSAATRIAWAAPESSIVVALDAGVRRVTPEPAGLNRAWEMWVKP